MNVVMKNMPIDLTALWVPAYSFLLRTITLLFIVYFLLFLFYASKKEIPCQILSKTEVGIGNIFSGNGGFRKEHRLN